MRCEVSSPLHNFALTPFHLSTTSGTQMTMVLMRSLQDDGLVDCKGAVANLAPSRARARLVRGTLDELGLGEIPVAIGTDGGFTKYTASFEDTSRAYIAPDDDTFDDTPGIGLLTRLYESASDGSLDLLCMCVTESPMPITACVTHTFSPLSLPQLIANGRRGIFACQRELVCDKNKDSDNHGRCYAI